jgi:phosphoribosyl 1,2-cyclic phosphate phosphodiesterase
VKARILGCGTSTGVPKIGNEWGACDPSEPRNRRMRTSLLFESVGKKLLVDCGPDLRQQMLDAECGMIDALVVTHGHGDHCHGIDDLRSLAAALDRPVPLHARPHTLNELEERFGYAFAHSDFYRPVVEAVPIADDWTFGEARVRVVDQPHGGVTSVGLRFDQQGKSLAYSIDFSDLSDDMAALYQGLDVWIADCLSRKRHPTHADLPRLLEWARECRVGHLYLVHMGNGLDYHSLRGELPDWAEPAYDGLEIVL